MSRLKDLYIQELERHMAELEDQGIPSDKAYELAGNRAYDSTRDRLADMADQLRQREKDK